MPEGPLVISDVHKEGCALKWKPPEDDGGAPVEYYEVEKMDADTGEFKPHKKLKKLNFYGHKVEAYGTQREFGTETCRLKLPFPFVPTVILL